MSGLLLRVDEWNVALAQYCDDHGLQGDECRVIIDKHTASPFDPCANPGCDRMEIVVKGFKSCARCKCVSYCGRGCQVNDWKKHKLCCVKA